MPLSRAALALMPTACEYRPMFVNRSSAQARIMQMTAMKIGVGTATPGRKLP